VIGLGFQDQKKQARAKYFFEAYSKPNTQYEKTMETSGCAFVYLFLYSV